MAFYDYVKGDLTYETDQRLKSLEESLKEAMIIIIKAQAKQINILSGEITYLKGSQDKLLKAESFL